MDAGARGGAFVRLVLGLGASKRVARGLVVAGAVLVVASLVAGGVYFGSARNQNKTESPAGAGQARFTAHYRPTPNDAIELVGRTNGSGNVHIMVMHVNGRNETLAHNWTAPSGAATEWLLTPPNAPRDRGLFRVVAAFEQSGAVMPPVVKYVFVGTAHVVIGDTEADLARLLSAGGLA